MGGTLCPGPTSGFRAPSQTLLTSKLKQGEKREGPPAAGDCPGRAGARRAAGWAEGKGLPAETSATSHRRPCLRQAGPASLPSLEGAWAPGSRDVWPTFPTAPAVADGVMGSAFRSAPWRPPGLEGNGSAPAVGTRRVSQASRRWPLLPVLGHGWSLGPKFEARPLCPHSHLRGSSGAGRPLWSGRGRAPPQQGRGSSLCLLSRVSQPLPQTLDSMLPWVRKQPMSPGTGDTPPAFQNNNNSKLR